MLQFFIAAFIAAFILFYFTCAAGLKEVIGRSPKGYISPIWGEAPSNGNVTKFCMWVSFPDVIIFARFYLYRPNSFQETDLE